MGLFSDLIKRKQLKKAIKQIDDINTTLDLMNKILKEDES
jgi:hypothetical protein